MVEETFFFPRYLVLEAVYIKLEKIAIYADIFKML